MDNPNIDNANSVKNPSPFITFTARTIPATFDTSMSYQEALFALVNYLQTQVTPAINENAHIINEQTKAINELYDFVNHYFDNLDVQEEINNKLDEMAESGQLSEIITAYLNAKSILAYNNKAEMKTATNIIDGSFLATYGNVSVNDSYVRFYKAREIKNTDIVDEINIVALLDENLVAELIQDARIDNINSTLSTVNTEISNIEDVQNKLTGRSRSVELACDLIYDENDTDINQGCAVIGDTLYSCERGVDNVTGKIVAFSLSNHTYLTSYNSVRIWHAGDATALNNKIYIASWNTSANKCLTVFDPANQSITDIYPFASATKPLVGAVANHNDKLLCKLEENSNLVQIIGAEYFLYNPSDNSVVEYTMTNPLNLPINYYGTTQSTVCKDNKYYIMTSNPNSIVECLIDDENHTLTMNAIYSIGLIDSRGLTIGELQGIDFNPYSENEMIITSYLQDNGINNVHTTKVYRLNLVNGNPNTLIKFPTDVMQENGQQSIKVDATSSSLLENGTTTYPFKSLSRAISCATHPNKLWNTISNITITGNGTYQLPKLFNKRFTLVASTGKTINFAQASDGCHIMFVGNGSRPTIVFDPSFGSSQIQNNCEVIFDNINLENTTNRVTIKKSIVRTYTPTVSANSNFFDLSENATFFDGSHTAWTFADPSYYAFNVTGGSQLFLFDNQSPFSPSSVAVDGRIRRSDRRGTVIFPNTYS